MDPLSLAVSCFSLADNVLRSGIFKGLGLESDTSLHVLQTCLFPKVDILCIPDLNEDPLTAWTEHKGSGKVNWLSNLLPKSCPQARIMSFQYSLSTRTPEGFARYTVYAQAYQLLEHLWKRRRGMAERRPLLFLVHNSGGLIAKSALIQSSAAITVRDAHLRSIYLSTGSLFIIDDMAGPETSSSSWTDLLAQTMNKVYQIHQISSSADNSLIYKAQKIPWFEWQQDRFRAIAGTITSVAIVVWNGPAQRTRTGLRLLDAAKGYTRLGFWGDDAKIRVLRRSRPELMKYEGLDDPEYQVLVDCLKQYIDSGASMANAKWSHVDYHNSLKPSKIEEKVSEEEKQYNQQLHETADACKKYVLKIRSELNVGVASRTTQNGHLADEAEREQEEAEKKVEVAKQVMRHFEETKGFSHPRTLDCLERLSAYCVDADLLDTADSVTQRLLVSWEACFGMQNRKFLHSIKRIATIKMEQGLYFESALYLKKVIDLHTLLTNSVEEKTKTGTVDSEHLGTLRETVQKDKETIARCQINLAVAYDMLEKFDKAGVLYQRVLSTRPDETDDCRLLALANQALHWRKRGNLLKAKETNEALLAAYKQKNLQAESRNKRPPISYREQSMIRARLKELDQDFVMKDSGQT